ncbi:zinc finger protein sens-like [Ostrea edulis]|uniref:zinc finger protein sens-like n=1 Tax=Ostrea edulis TaxID=37623 RepID=UPI0020945382|nr:zinc finger protein sens-like [Ostrea edulis]
MRREWKYKTRFLDIESNFKMDLGCNMEFSFPEAGQLNDAMFGTSQSSIADKLDLGTVQLLDTVSGTTQCVGHHDNVDKHLSASDFRLDLGPANDLVSTTDFPLVNPVPDIGTDSVEECSEGYSIVNAALEGGGILTKQPIPSSNTLNLGNVTNIQPIQLNQASLLGMPAIQVIPIENMQLLSSIKSLGHCQNIQPSPATPIQPGTSATPLVQSNSPAAVLLGNVLLLQSLPGQFNQNNLSYQSTSSHSHQSIATPTQILQISNDPNTAGPVHNTIVQDSLRGKVVSEILEEGVTIKTLLQKSNRNASMHIKRRELSKFQESINGGQSPVSCNERKPVKVYVDKQTDTEYLSHSKESSDNQKNTKILVYGKNIALTFDCRNQNFVMESLTKAMKGNQTPSPKEVSIEIGKTVDTDIQQKVGEFNSSFREVKYVSILNPVKKAKTESSDESRPLISVKTGGDEICANDQDEDPETEHQQFRMIDIASTASKIGTVTPDSREMHYSRETISSECEPRTNSEMVSVDPGESSDKVAVLSVVKQDQRLDELDQDDEEHMYKCDLCSASFSRVGNYTRHRMIHTVNTQDNYRYKCSDCGRLFLQRCDMKRHMLIHTKQEPHRCTVCNKGYIRKSDLVVHMRFHSKDRAYKCTHCEKQFFQSGDLNRHVRNVHLLAPLLKCGHCNRQFVKESTLIRHMQTTHKDIIIKSLRDKLDKTPTDKQMLTSAKACSKEKTQDNSRF